MTGDHFKEVLGTICLSTRSSKKQIADYLFVSKVTINIWLREGIPRKQSIRIMKKLRHYLFTNLGGSKDGSDRGEQQSHSYSL